MLLWFDRAEHLLSFGNPYGEFIQHTQERSATWSTETTLHQKLHGDLDDWPDIEREGEKGQCILEVHTFERRC